MRAVNAGIQCLNAFHEIVGDKKSPEDEPATRQRLLKLKAEWEAVYRELTVFLGGAGLTYQETDFTRLFYGLDLLREIVP